jgi:penicillin-binding protein 2
VIKLGRKSDTRELRPRVVALGVCFVAGLFVLAINLYRLMVVRYDEFLALSVDNQFKDVRLRAPRGLVRDRRGEVLVDARPSLDVFITPAFCQRCTAEVLPRLAEVLGWDEAERARVEALVKSAHGPQRYQPLVAAVDVSREAFDQLLARQFLLPGIDLEPVPHRSYRAGPTLAHLVGYMNEITQEELTRLNGVAERPPYALGDYIGRRGVERSFEHEVRGTDGWDKHVVNARGELMRDSRGNVLKGGQQQPAVPGNSVVLSIDARLQAEAERAFPGTAGAVVAIETKTGFIRAMVSRPAFDPNEMTGRVSPRRLAQLKEDPLQPMVFRAGAEHYHPGSTFKVVTLLAALQQGVMTPTSQVSCSGGYTLGSRRWRCHNERGHGLVDAKRALQVSCDTYFYRAADVMGIEPIAQVGKAFGLGAVTNLGVAAEVPGVMPDTAYHNRLTPGGYTKGMALNTAIGQGDTNVTPLQLAVLYSAIGNRGKVLQPQLVLRLEGPDGKVTKAFAPKVVREVPMTDEQHRLLVDALVSVVNEPGGTAFRTRSTDFTVAGKTGTAQVAKLGQVRLKKEQMDYFERDHAWFAAFAPAEDPELTVVVLNEHGGHGGSDAAPTAAAVFARYFELKRADAFALGEDWVPPKPPKPVFLPQPAAPPEVSEPALASDIPAPPEPTVQAPAAPPPQVPR